jgi:hypothetical protein
MSSLPECDKWCSLCHALNDEESKKCAEENKVKCFNFNGWKHYPRSPFGDIWICPHGCVRGKEEIILKIKVCRFCDER